MILISPLVLITTALAVASTVVAQPIQLRELSGLEV